jgi:ketosteroid isomerase-like protein
MDPAYAIRVAKMRLRDGYRTGSVEKVLAVYADEFSDMSAGLPSFFGSEAKEVLRYRLRELFKRFRVDLEVTIISISVCGNLAFDWGWHKITLTPKKGGKPTSKRTRYIEIWKKDPARTWKIRHFFDNSDVKPRMPAPEVLRALSKKSRETRRKKA